MCSILQFGWLHTCTCTQTTSFLLKPTTRRDAMRRYSHMYEQFKIQKKYNDQANFEIRFFVNFITKMFVKCFIEVLIGCIVLPLSCPHNLGFGVLLLHQITDESAAYENTSKMNVNVFRF